jgi:hypothetical protein
MKLPNRILGVCLILLIAINAVAQTSENSIAIVGATLIDGSGKKPSKNWVVIVSGDSIEKVGKQKR